MNYQTFLSNIELEIKTRIPDNWSVNIRPFPKNNGVIYDGLVIMQPDLNISPTVYLNPYYHRYLDGVELNDIYEDILSTYHHFVPKENIDVDSFLQFENVKKKIILKLINHDKNATYLETVPHQDYLDFAIIYQVYMGEDTNGFSTITVTDRLLAEWNKSIDELHELALDNSPRIFPYRLRNIQELVPVPIAESIFKMHVLTNNSKINGATAILYPNLLQDIAEDFDNNLILIPSSIHEFLIVQDYSENEPEFFNHMIREVNEVELSDYEILSDHAYFYSRADKKLYSI